MSASAASLDKERQQYEERKKTAELLRFNFSLLKKFFDIKTAAERVEIFNLLLEECKENNELTLLYNSFRQRYAHLFDIENDPKAPNNAAVSNKFMVEYRAVLQQEMQEMDASFNNPHFVLMVNRIVFALQSKKRSLCRVTFTKDLNNNGIKFILNNLSVLLSQSSSLVSLEIAIENNNFPYESNAWNEMVQALRDNTTLEIIKLDNKDLEGNNILKPMCSILNAIIQHKKINQIIISINGLYHDSFFISLLNKPSLRKLHLGCVIDLRNSSPQTEDEIVKAIESSSCEALELPAIISFDSFLDKTYEALSKNKNIFSLNLGINTITKNGMQYIAKMLKGKDSQLRKFYIMTGLISELAQILDVNTNLQVLGITLANETPDVSHYVKLMQVINKHSSLTRLNYYDPRNRAGFSSSFKHVLLTEQGSSFLTSSNLTTLDLSRPSFISKRENSSEDIEFIAQFLATNKTVTNFLIRFNELTNDDVLVLAKKGLSNNNTLRHIDLSHNKIQGGRTRVLNPLYGFDVDGRLFSDQFRLCSHNPNLHSISFLENPIREDQCIEGMMAGRQDPLIYKYKLIIKCNVDLGISVSHQEWLRRRELELERKYNDLMFYQASVYLLIAWYRANRNHPLRHSILAFIKNPNYKESTSLFRKILGLDLLESAPAGFVDKPVEFEIAPKKPDSDWHYTYFHMLNSDKLLDSRYFLRETTRPQLLGPSENQQQADQDNESRSAPNKSK